MAAITSVLEDRRTRSRDLEEDILQAKNLLVETDPRSFIKVAVEEFGDSVLVNYIFKILSICIFIY